MTGHDFDRDPDALAWAAAKVEKALERVEGWVKDAKAQGDWARAKGLGVAAMSIRGQLLGRGPCVVGAFDARRPAIEASMDVGRHHMEAKAAGADQPAEAEAFLGVPLPPPLSLLPPMGPQFCHHPAARASVHRTQQAGWGLQERHTLTCPDCGQYAESLTPLRAMAPTPLPPDPAS